MTYIDIYLMMHPYVYQVISKIHNLLIFYFVVECKPNANSLVPKRKWGNERCMIELRWIHEHEFKAKSTWSLQIEIKMVHKLNDSKHTFIWFIITQRKSQYFRSHDIHCGWWQDYMKVANIFRIFKCEFWKLPIKWNVVGF